MVASEARDDGASEARVDGVPACVSVGGGDGLPERVRDGRGALPETSDLGGRAMRQNMAEARANLKPSR